MINLHNSKSVIIFGKKITKMKRLIALCFLAVMCMVSSFTSKPLPVQSTKVKTLFNPTVVSSNIYKDADGANITIVYSGDWTGMNGSTNPDLEVDITLTVYEVGRGITHIEVTPILIFYGYAGAGQPEFIGEADIPGSAIIQSWTINSSTPIF
jgi:hypothetical protein